MKQERTRIGRTSVSGARAAGRTAARRPRRRAAGLLLAPVLVWALAATWFAYRGRAEVDRLAAEAEVQKAAYEDKVRALTRRLVGVASHQALEQDGLAGRMADILTRQVELENRVATLSAYADRLAAPQGAEAEPARARTEGDVPRPAARAASPERAVPEPNVLRLGGAPPAPPPPPPAPGPRSSLDGPGERGEAGERARRFALLTTREQFDALDMALAKVERLQLGVLDRFRAGLHGGVGRIRTILAGLGIAPAAAAVSPPAPPRQALVRTPLVRTPFDEGARLLDIGFEELRLWRAAAESAPLRRPLEGAERSLTSNFGMRKDPFTGALTMHAGMDFRAPVGTSITAGGAGRVITAAQSGGYGNLVEIDHGNGLVTRYGHLSAYAVSVGQAVRPDTIIGMVGSTGRSTGPHLHYETRVNGAAVDPIRFLKAGAVLYDREPLPEAGAQSGESSED